MMKLSDRNWKEFYISEIFQLLDNKLQVPTGNYINKKYMKKGNTPRITVTSNNNGIDNFWNILNDNTKYFENFISVSFLGQAFYHKYKASIDMKVHCLQLKNHTLNQYIGLFITSIINNKFNNYSYGNQLSSSDLPNKKIYLPITSDFQPDYDFMENYMKYLEQKKLSEYLKYIENSERI